MKKFKYFGPLQIFLLTLIVIGLGLLATQKIWVPKLVEKILYKENIGLVQPITINNKASSLDQEKSQTAYIATLKDSYKYPNEYEIFAVDEDTLEGRLVAVIPKNNINYYMEYNSNKIYYQNSSTTLAAYDLETKQTTTLNTSSNVTRFLVSPSLIFYLSGKCTPNDHCAIGPCGDSTPCDLWVYDILLKQDRLLISDLPGKFNDLGLETFDLIGYNSQNNSLKLSVNYSGMEVLYDYIYEINLNDLSKKLVIHYDSDMANCKTNCSSEVKNNKSAYYELISQETSSCGGLRFDYIDGYPVLRKISNPEQKFINDNSHSIFQLIGCTKP